jgi:hypothetical protein
MADSLQFLPRAPMMGTLVRDNQQPQPAVLLFRGGTILVASAAGSHVSRLFLLVLQPATTTVKRGPEKGVYTVWERPGLGIRKVRHKFSFWPLAPDGALVLADLLLPPAGASTRPSLWDRARGPTPLPTGGPANGLPPPLLGGHAMGGTVPWLGVGPQLQFIYCRSKSKAHRRGGAGAQRSVSLGGRARGGLLRSGAAADLPDLKPYQLSPSTTRRGAQFGAVGGRPRDANLRVRRKYFARRPISCPPAFTAPPLPAPVRAVPRMPFPPLPSSGPGRGPAPAVGRVAAVVPPVFFPKRPTAPAAPPHPPAHEAESVPSGLVVVAGMAAAPPPLPVPYDGALNWRRAQPAQGGAEYGRAEWE